jgi:hypothetical protein
MWWWCFRDFAGVQHVIFYAPAENSQYYSEIVSMATHGASNAASVTGSSTLLFSIFDSLALERIAGSLRSRKLLTAASDVSVFC